VKLWFYSVSSSVLYWTSYTGDKASIRVWEVEDSGVNEERGTAVKSRGGCDLRQNCGLYVV
jgi:hypothetical protein